MSDVIAAVGGSVVVGSMAVGFGLVTDSWVSNWNFRVLIAAHLGESIVRARDLEMDLYQIEVRAGVGFDFE